MYFAESFLQTKVATKLNVPEFPERLKIERFEAISRDSRLFIKNKTIVILASSPYKN